MDKFTKFFSNIIGKLQVLSKTQKIVTAVVAATSVAVIGGGAVAVSSLGNGGEASVAGTESTEVFEFMEETTESTEMVEPTEVISDITVSIKTTSIYEDLKIKIVDENGDLVKGFPFEIILTPVDVEGEEDMTSKEYNDHDMDGIIYLQGLKGGDYVIDLKELEGIIISKNSVKATVKSEIKYEKIEDVKNEIKADNAAEDTAQNNVVVEAVVTDTLPLIESKVIPVEISKDKVDFSNFQASSVSQESNTATLNKTKSVQSLEVSILSIETYTLMSANLLGEDTIVTSTTAAIESVASKSENSVDVISEPTTAAQTEEPTTTEPTTAAPEEPTTTEPTTAPPDETTGEGGTGGSDGATEDTIVAFASAELPKSVELYLYGNDNSKNATVSLSVEDEKSLIQNISWSISDSNIVDFKVADDNKSAEVTAKTAGTAVISVKITYTADETGKTKSSELSCTVNVGNPTDTTTQIKSTSNEPLYLDSAAKKIATPASYATATTFYTTPKYTGWQTIDGKLYYYQSNNKPATGNQVIGGIQYSFNSDGSLVENTQSYGIDVSKWQGSIDWAAVAQSGVKFAVIRCAYRGSSDGLIHEDPYFRANIQGATQNGIKVGVYFFTQAVNEIEAIEEASMAIALVQGYKLNLPIFIDTENATNGRANGLDVATRTSVVKAFCETVRNSGYKPGIYASKSWYYNKLDMSQLSTYNIWVAQYNTSCNYTGRYDMWQYTSKGSVPGINGNVDLNICYTNY